MVFHNKIELLILIKELTCKLTSPRSKVLCLLNKLNLRRSHDNQTLEEIRWQLITIPQLKMNLILKDHSLKRVKREELQELMKEKLKIAKSLFLSILIMILSLFVFLKSNLMTRLWNILKSSKEKTQMKSSKTSATNLT